MTLIHNRRKVNFRSIADLNALVLDNLSKLPDGLTVVVAVPRSGYIVAGLIALNLNLPLCSYNEYITRTRPTGGRRARQLNCGNQRHQKVLIVDDSVSSGWEMRRIQKELAEHATQDERIFLAAYVSAKASDLVDIALEITDPPQIFEWNLYHHPHLINSCVDIDGVLCRDARKEEDDDGVKYLRFIEHVPPRIVPTVEVGWLVTSRLEKYRAPTEAWLEKHGIQYRNLIMQNLPDLRTRYEKGNDARFKADVYSGLDAFLFLESSAWQSKEIARQTGKAVFCVDDRTFMQAEVLEGRVGDTARRVSRTMNRVNRIFRKISGKQ